MTVEKGFNMRRAVWSQTNAEGGCFAPFVGQSGAFESIIETIETVALRRSSVIIVGETGTGKEMVARQIHARSCRAKESFIPVDCTALSGNILESQLFGHVKGSFTGAVMDTVGFFRAADGGTIFLDEIGELDFDLQAKLLRVLPQRQKVRGWGWGWISYSKFL